LVECSDCGYFRLFQFLIGTLETSD